jgi:Calcineurin-like phosphoesterase
MFNFKETNLMLTFRKAYSTFYHHAVKSTSILHITDPEGTKFFFDTVKKSKIVNLHPEKGLQFNTSSSTPFFIFGGDATDRGPYDLAITKLLVEFKKRHPHNVALLVGNREIKNNRFKIELAPSLIRQRLIKTKPPRWLAANQQSVPLDALKSKIIFKDDKHIHDYVESLTIEECQLLYLHWMLDKNMGCPGTFQYRREELQRQHVSAAVTDLEVLQSFIKETSPTGLMGEYLKLGQMGVIVPNTRVLAVHGGLTPLNIGRTPGMPVNAKPIADARLWIDELNAWYAKQIQSWSEYESTTVTDPACTDLDEAVLPIPGKAKQVVTADMLSADRQFTTLADEVSDYLLTSKISVVLTGHQPCGDHPAFLRNKDDNLLFINADTGYANFNPAKPHDTRGVAGHSLEIIADDKKTSITVDATLSTGQAVKTSLAITPDTILGDPYIGKLLAEGYLVQCKLETGDYRLVKQQGFQVFYKNMSVIELEANLEKEKMLSHRARYVS